MDIRVATAKFERWLKGQTKIVRGDLRHKHLAMGDDPFCFLRATYYRWAQQFFELDKEISAAPVVLSVGDLHLENFGTWRDALGRLAWGINDFDEAYPLPYTNDLIRLATSTLVAIDNEHLGIRPKAACQALLDGYREGLHAGGRPFVIGDEHRWFKPILQSPQRDPGAFWDKLRELPSERMALPEEARQAVTQMLPEPALRFELRHRVCGLGNLGKPRFTAIAHWQGGPIAREAKALTLSAAAWVESRTSGPFYAQILAAAIRSPDPFLHVSGNWITRRLSPDCRRLELSSLSRSSDEEWLLHAMGFETANVHLGAGANRRACWAHLVDLPKGWLKTAATTMQDLLLKDFKRWKKR